MPEKSGLSGPGYSYQMKVIIFAKSFNSIYSRGPQMGGWSTHRVIRWVPSPFLMKSVLLFLKDASSLRVFSKVSVQKLIHPSRKFLRPSRMSNGCISTSNPVLSRNLLQDFNCSLTKFPTVNFSFFLLNEDSIFARSSNWYFWENIR